MRSKLLISITLTIVLVGVATAWHSVSKVQTVDTGIRIFVTQLPEESNGLVPVHITQPTAISSVPNILEDLTYTLINNSDKPIKALAISQTIEHEKGGKLYTTSTYLTLDYSFHADIDRGRLFDSRTQIPITASGPSRFSEGTVIKTIKLKIAFIQYADDTRYGAGGEGERRITQMREGALKYKNWLENKYFESGKSMSIVLPLLRQVDNPEELKLNVDEILGASSYRNHLLKTLQTKGAGEVEKYLKQK
jgi:hypothetical protein